MMGLYSVAVFVIFVGISQAETCDPTKACATDDNRVKEFPTTAEEFDLFCGQTVPFVECSVKEAEKCDPESEIFKVIQKVSPIFLRMCNEDSLLNKAIKENVECFHSNLAEIMQCNFVAIMNDEDIIKAYMDSLAENGISFTDEEHQNDCPQSLYTASCMAASGGQACGDVAKSVIIELLQGMDALAVCSEENAGKLNIAVDVMETKIAEGQAFQAVFVRK